MLVALIRNVGLGLVWLCVCPTAAPAEPAEPSKATTGAPTTAAPAAQPVERVHYSDNPWDEATCSLEDGSVRELDCRGLVTGVALAL